MYIFSLRLIAFLWLLEIIAASNLVKRKPACSTFYGAPSKEQCLLALNEMPDTGLSRPDEVLFVPSTTVLAGRQGLPLVWSKINFGVPDVGEGKTSMCSSHASDRQSRELPHQFEIHEPN